MDIKVDNEIWEKVSSVLIQEKWDSVKNDIENIMFKNIGRKLVIEQRKNKKPLCFTTGEFRIEYRGGLYGYIVLPFKIYELDTTND